MLLYHFPLTSSFENKGFINEDFVVNQNSSIDSTYGKLASKSMKVSSETYGGIVIPFVTTNMTELSICFRCYLTTRHDWRGIFSIDGTKYINIAYADFSMFWYGNGHVLAKNVQNKWNDLVMTVANDNLSFYLNGEKVYDYSLPTTLAQYITSYITVGARSKGPYGTTSLQDAFYQDIRIYDYALSQAEINEYSRALVVHYPLQGNELNQSVLKDVSGFGNDYTLQGTNSYQLDSARGVKSLHTTDTAIYTQTPISSGYTTSFWCKYNGEWKHLCNNGSKYMNGVVNSSLYDTIYATLTASGYDIVDYRVYATALSAEDIKNLYNSPIAVSKQHQTMAFEFVEGNDGFSAKKNGIVQHNELRENDSDVNGCYNDKLITNKLIEQ